MYNTLIKPKQINELSAIYQDFLCAVRQQEEFLQNSSVRGLMDMQIDLLYRGKNPDFPWVIDLLDSSERQEFHDFLLGKVRTDVNHSYISSQHTNPDEDLTPPIEYIPQEYTFYQMDMSLPAAIERNVIAYQDNALVEQTEFFINGRYKASYSPQEKTGLPLSEIFRNRNFQSEMRILLNFTDMLYKNKEFFDENLKRMITNVYADEASAPFENTILEILGSFADKIQEICRDIYRGDPLQQAEKDNLISSAAVFQDYINIRNLMRHQIDTMDELGYFTNSKASRNSAIRRGYLESYRRLCDKTIVQRTKSYVEALHHMQHTLLILRPDILIRGVYESNSKFTARVKNFHRQNPDKDIVVELNYPLFHEKYKALHKNLHKILPQIKITDDFNTPQNEVNNPERDYQLRSWFLRTYHSLECSMMWYCMTRGKNYNNKSAWDYFRYNRLISTQDYQTWRSYTDLRNDLSHGYFNPDLRQQLRQIEDSYLKSLNDLERKIQTIRPDIFLKQPGVYEFVHNDGLRITIDFNSRKMIGNQNLYPEERSVFKNKTAHKNNTPYIETFSNGLEIITMDGKVLSVKTPDGVNIDFEKQRILWNAETKLLANAENFNILKVFGDKLFFDKNSHVTEYWKKGHKQKIIGGDTFLIGNAHNVTLDRLENLKEFNFRNPDDKNIKTTFKRTTEGMMLNFADGTQISLQNNNLVVTHNNQVLSFKNRRQFAATYSTNGIVTSQIVKSGHGRR